MTTIYTFPQFEPQPDETDYPHPCTMCHRAFSVASNLRRHIKSVHSLEKPFACDFCDRQFSQRCNLKRHVRIHTGEKPYTCNTCGVCFSDQTVYKAHMFRHRKPFKNADLIQQLKKEEEDLIAPVPVRPILRKIVRDIGTCPSSCFVHVKEGVRGRGLGRGDVKRIKVGSEFSAFSKIASRFCDSSSLGSEVTISSAQADEWNAKELSR
jgi:hypothetical protein